MIVGPERRCNVSEGHRAPFFSVAPRLIPESQVSSRGLTNVGLTWGQTGRTCGIDPSIRRSTRLFGAALATRALGEVISADAY